MKKNKKNKKSVKKAKKEVKVSVTKEVLKNVMYFFVGIIAVVVVLIVEFLKLIWRILKYTVLGVSKVLDIMPKALRGAIILALIVYSLYATLGANKKISAIDPEKKTNIIENVDAENIQVQKTCQLSEIECKIYNEAISQGLTDYQSKMALAISKWETGNWTSSLYESNNFGGLYVNGHFKSYASQDEGIRDYIRVLKLGYFNKGKDTLEKIQVNYCPVGAKNDPKGLNKNWLKGTNKFLNEYRNMEIVK